MLISITFLKEAFLAIFFFQMNVQADFSVQLSSCPSGFQRINNGCYDFEENRNVDAKTANLECKKILQNSTTLSHLIAFETLAETIAISFWMKGSNYSSHFWTDGVNDANNKKIWDWNKQNFYNHGYLKVDFLNGANNNAFLKYNSSQLYELDDNPVISKFGYICEAQVPCLPADNVCHNNGTCYVNAGTALCYCPSGYQGNYCEIMIDNCKSSPCYHGGTCKNLPNNFSCSCTPYFDGYKCDNALSYKHEQAQHTVLIIAITIVCAILLFLCMLDLPWKAIWAKTKSCFNKLRGEETTRKQNNNVLNHQVSKNSEIISADAMISSEREMLKKLRIAVKNSQSRSRIQPNTPSN